ncbi:hypothetical protein, partial [Streptomyces lycii]
MYVRRGLCVSSGLYVSGDLCALYDGSDLLSRPVSLDALPAPLLPAGLLPGHLLPGRGALSGRGALPGGGAGRPGG